MKLTMEFEEEDVSGMLEQHFLRNGFRVRNLDELVSAFMVAYPDGIKVQVDALPPTAVPEPAVVEVNGTPAVNVVRETPDNEPSVASRVKGNPKLSFTDISDPEFKGIDKSIAPDEDAMQREIQHILQSSEAITKARSGE